MLRAYESGVVPVGAQPVRAQHRRDRDRLSLTVAFTGCAAARRHAAARIRRGAHAPSSPITTSNDRGCKLRRVPACDGG